MSKINRKTTGSGRYPFGPAIGSAVASFSGAESVITRYIRTLNGTSAYGTLNSPVAVIAGDTADIVFACPAGGASQHLLDNIVEFDAGNLLQLTNCTATIDGTAVADGASIASYLDGKLHTLQLVFTGADIITYIGQNGALGGYYKGEVLSVTCKDYSAVGPTGNVVRAMADRVYLDSAASATPDAYNNTHNVVITSGTGSGQSRQVVDYDVESVTNSLPYSNDISNAAWSKTALLTYTQDQTGIFGGLNTAWTIGDPNTSGYESMKDSIAITTSFGKHYYSIYVKKDSDETRFPELQVRLIGGSGTRIGGVQLNTKTGAFALRDNIGAAVVDYGVIPLASGEWWQLYIALQDNNSGTTEAEFSFYPAVTTVWGTAQSSAVGSCVVDHSQLRLNSSSPGEIVPTSGVAVTETVRVAHLSSDFTTIPQGPADSTYRVEEIGVSPVVTDYIIDNESTTTTYARGNTAPSTKYIAWTNLTAADIQSCTYNQQNRRWEGVERITDSGFDTACGVNWTCGTGWTIASGTASCDGTQIAVTNLSENIGAIIGSRYLHKFVMTSFTAGTLTPFFGTAAGTARSEAGLYSEVGTQAGDAVSYNQGDITFIGTIDGVSVKQVWELP